MKLTFVSLITIACLHSVLALPTVPTVYLVRRGGDSQGSGTLEHSLSPPQNDAASVTSGTPPEPSETPDREHQRGRKNSRPASGSRSSSTSSREYVGLTDGWNPLRSRSSSTSSKNSWPASGSRSSSTSSRESRKPLLSRSSSTSPSRSSTSSMEYDDLD